MLAGFVPTPSLLPNTLEAARANNMFLDFLSSPPASVASMKDRLLLLLFPLLSPNPDSLGECVEEPELVLLLHFLLLGSSLVNNQRINEASSCYCCCY